MLSAEQGVISFLSEYWSSINPSEFRSRFLASSDLRSWYRIDSALMNLENVLS